MKIKVFKIRLDDEFLNTDQNAVNDFLENVQMKKSSTALVQEKEPFWSVIFHYEDLDEKKVELIPKVDEKLKAENKISEADLSENEQVRAGYLKQWRTEMARSEGLPAYRILWNQEIYDLARANPSDLDELLKVKGFGEIKVEKYGDDLISLLNAV